MRLLPMAARAIIVLPLLLALQARSQPINTCGPLEPDQRPLRPLVPAGPDARGEPVAVADGVIFGRDTVQSAMEGWRLPQELRVPVTYGRKSMILVYPAGTEIAPARFESNTACLPTAFGTGARIYACLVDQDRDGRYDWLDLSWNNGAHINYTGRISSQALPAPLRPTPNPAGLSESRTHPSTFDHAECAIGPARPRPPIWLTLCVDRAPPRARSRVLAERAGRRSPLPPAALSSTRFSRRRAIDAGGAPLSAPYDAAGGARHRPRGRPGLHRLRPRPSRPGPQRELDPAGDRGPRPWARLGCGGRAVVVTYDLPI